MTDVERVRVYEKDHAPDGFPAVEMALLTRLADRVVELEKRVPEWEYEKLAGQLLSARDERDTWREEAHKRIEDMTRLCGEIDALKSQLARAKAELFCSRAFFTQADFEEYFKREVEEGGA